MAECIDAETINQLIVLARRRKARTSEFSESRPTDWRPQQVENPNSEFEKYFTDSAAWEFIADKLEEGHRVETVELRKPPGAKGYVMKFDLGVGNDLYVKLQLGSGVIIGRSFHYSTHKKFKVGD